MNPKLTLLLGGARSGKSRYAEELAADCGERVLYVATARAQDDEMVARIAAHRQGRPEAWRTVEAPTGVGLALRDALNERDAGPVDAVLLDCLTLLISNVILVGISEDHLDDLGPADEEAARRRVSEELSQLLAVLNASELPSIVVSNEVGWGLVPPYPLGRIYRDLLGWANQRVASQAHHVCLMVAGLPVDLRALSAASLADE